MTAIYHRLSLLDQNIDEAGAAFESQGKQIALSINQGDSRFNILCQKNRPLSGLSRSFYQDACHGHAIVYADEISNRKFRPYVTYPQGNFASPVFHGERPDPMPHYEMTGNPVSIAFSEQSPPVKMRSFKLYRDTKEIRDVKILDKDNDPNRLLTERQFALFPLTAIGIRHQLPCRVRIPSKRKRQNGRMDIQHAKTRLPLLHRQRRRNAGHRIRTKIFYPLAGFLVLEAMRTLQLPHEPRHPNRHYRTTGRRHHYPCQRKQRQQHPLNARRRRQARHYTLFMEIKPFQTA